MRRRSTATIPAALTSTGVSYADDVAAHVHQRLGAYADALVATEVDACEAHQRGDQSDALYDRRMTCLDERRTALGALVAQPKRRSSSSISTTGPRCSPRRSSCSIRRYMPRSPA